MTSAAAAAGTGTVRADAGVLGLLGLSAALSVQWVAVVESPIGTIRPFHLVAAVVVATVALDGRRHEALGEVVARTHWVLLVFGLYTTVLVGFAAYRGIAVYAANALQQASYAAIGLVVAAVLLDLLRDPERCRPMIWTSPIALVSFCVFFYRAATGAGVRVIPVIQDAIRRADPAALEYTLFRAAFTGSGTELQQANIRHEIMAWLLVAALISVVALRVQTDPRRRERMIVWTAVGCSAAVMVLSLSRAVLLAAALLPLMLVLRPIVTRRASLVAVGSLGIVVLVVVIAVTSPVATLFLERVTEDTGSYDTRTYQLQASLLIVQRNALFGVPYTPYSPHNFVIQAWLLGGVLAAGTATMFVAATLTAWIRSTIAAISGTTWQMVVAATAIGLPVVRLFTAGDGTLHLVEWLALALFVALATDVERVRAPRPLASRRAAAA